MTKQRTALEMMEWVKSKNFENYSTEKTAYRHGQIKGAMHCINEIKANDIRVDARENFITNILRLEDSESDFDQGYKSALEEGISALEKCEVYK